LCYYTCVVTPYSVLCHLTIILTTITMMVSNLTAAVRGDGSLKSP